MPYSICIYIDIYTCSFSLVAVSYADCCILCLAFCVSHCVSLILCLSFCVSHCVSLTDSNGVSLTVALCVSECVFLIVSLSFCVSHCVSLTDSHCVSLILCVSLCVSQRHSAALCVSHCVSLIVCLTETHNTAVTFPLSFYLYHFTHIKCVKDLFHQLFIPCKLIYSLLLFLKLIHSINSHVINME